ncbi:MAG: ribbon-helix-helix protein, CopG family [Promethearchaeota archaeon]|nr:MAG: ribbon-helix-helix protein, CopG family [Candidatus Lokiarchaeota archaeon]
MKSVLCIIFFEWSIYIIVSQVRLHQMPMVSLQLSDDTLQKFDKVQRESGYLSRSEALRDAILKFIGEQEQKQDTSEIKRSIVTVVYKSDPTKMEMFSSIEQRFDDIVKTFTEYMMKDQILRIYVIIGKLSRINDFTESFNKIKDTMIDSLFI